jgi:hypothetical protein
LGPESPGRKIQPVGIGNLGYLRPRPWNSFLLSSSGQPGKPFFSENQRDGNGAHPLSTLFQDPADIIDGEILFSQDDDLIPDTVGFRRSLRPLLREKEELTIWMLAELVGENAEASRGIPEAVRHFDRREIIDEVGPEGFILTVRGIRRFEKEAGHRC